MRANYPVTGWVRTVDNEWFIVVGSTCCQNVKFCYFTLMFCGVRQEKALKCVPHVQDNYFSLFNQ